MKRDIIVIVLILLSSVVAIKDISRISNKKAQRARIKTIRMPVNRSLVML